MPYFLLVWGPFVESYLGAAADDELVLLARMPKKALLRLNRSHHEYNVYAVRGLLMEKGYPVVTVSAMLVGDDRESRKPGCYSPLFKSTERVIIRNLHDKQAFPSTERLFCVSSVRALLGSSSGFVGDCVPSP